MKTPRKIEPIDVDAIYIGERLRSVSVDRVEAIASSMKEIGLMTPISVRYFEEYIIDGEAVRGVPVLVAGATRLAAAKMLGWEFVDCLYVEGDDLDAQLWEIDENLARSELTTEQKREHLRHRKEIWEKREKMGGTSRPTHDALGRKKSPQQEQSFAAETAAATGLSKRQINRLMAEPKATDTHRPPTVVKLPDEPLNEFEVTQQQVSALMSAWNKAAAEAREQFLSLIDRPTFDRTRAGAA